MKRAVVVAGLVFILDFLAYKLPKDSCFKFFYIPFGDLLNIIVIGCIGYLFIEQKNSQRSKRQFLEGLVLRMISRMDCSRMYKINNVDDINNIRLVQRTVFNELGILKNNCHDDNVRKHIERCEYHMSTYWDCVSRHIDDVDCLIQATFDLQNHITNFVNDAERIVSSLYEQN